MDPSPSPPLSPRPGSATIQCPILLLQHKAQTQNLDESEVITGTGVYLYIRKMETVHWLLAESASHSTSFSGFCFHVDPSSASRSSPISNLQSRLGDLPFFGLQLPPSDEFIFLDHPLLLNCLFQLPFQVYD